MALLDTNTRIKQGEKSRSKPNLQEVKECRCECGATTGYDNLDTYCERCGSRVNAVMKTLVIRDRVLGRGFAALPRIVLRDKNYSISERLVYALLLDYAWQDGECWPGQDRMADDIGVTTRQLRTVLDQLAKHGLITVKRQGLGKPNIYYIEDLRKIYPQFIDKARRIA